MKWYPYFCLIFVLIPVVSNATNPLLLAWISVIEISQSPLLVEIKKKEHEKKNNNEMKVALLHPKNQQDKKPQRKLRKVKRTLPRNKG